MNAARAAPSSQDMKRAVVVLFIAACSKKPQITSPQPAGTRPVPAPTAPAATQAASPQLGVSQDLAKQCRLHFAPAEVPQFAYDDFALLPEDRAVLERVASCITSGPLRGRTLELVGRADPRGTQEYNLGLGHRRANTVSSYLQRLGVATTQLATATRGDLDAKGTDEASWRTDRRVDIVLRN